MDSNDTLYGPDELFRQQIDNAINILMHDAIRSIIQLKMNDHYASMVSSEVCEEFFLQKAPNVTGKSLGEFSKISQQQAHFDKWGLDFSFRID